MGLRRHHRRRHSAHEFLTSLSLSLFRQDIQSLSEMALSFLLNCLAPFLFGLSNSPFDNPLSVGHAANDQRDQHQPNHCGRDSAAVRRPSGQLAILRDSSVPASTATDDQQSLRRSSSATSARIISAKTPPSHQNTPLRDRGRLAHRTQTRSDQQARSLRAPTAVCRCCRCRRWERSTTAKL